MLKKMGKRKKNKKIKRIQERIAYACDCWECGSDKIRSMTFNVEKTEELF